MKIGWIDRLYNLEVIRYFHSKRSDGCVQDKKAARSARYQTGDFRKIIDLVLEEKRYGDVPTSAA
jgi:hypothetical protein